MTDLKPCPFCGGSHITEWEVTTFSVDSSYDMFGCADCRIGFDDGRDEENIRTWNTRAGPKVKPLEWVVSKGEQKAGSLGFSYYLELTHGQHSLSFSALNYFKLIYKGSSEEKAKAAAQRDYERRILSALETET